MLIGTIFQFAKKREKIFLVLNAEEIFLTCHVFRRQCLKPIQAEHDKKEREKERERERERERRGVERRKNKIYELKQHPSNSSFSCSRIALRK